MKVLGVDPGTGITGYGLVSQKGNKLSAIDFGTIKPPTQHPLPARYLIIFEGICNLIEAFSPDALSVESQFVYKNPQSALKLGMAKGAVLIAAAKYSLPVFEYTPRKAKLAIVGNGKASKIQVQMMVQRVLNLPAPPTPDDAADALALSICHLNTNREL